MTDIYIEGQAAIVGPDDCLVVTLPAWVSAEEHDRRSEEFSAAIKDSPLAGRVLLMSGIQDIAVVTPRTPPEGSCVSCPNRDPLVATQDTP